MSCCSRMCWGLMQMLLCAPLRKMWTAAFWQRRLICSHPEEKQIITMRFGLGGGNEQTQKEVADQLEFPRAISPG